MNLKSMSPGFLKYKALSSLYFKYNFPFVYIYYTRTHSEAMIFDAEPDIPPDYVFDVNADVSAWNQNDDVPFSNGINIQQDFNNNDGISFDDSGFENENNNNNNDRIQLRKGEYSYHAFGNIRNFWAGPTYWKFSKNLNQSTHRPSENGNKSGRRKKKSPKKPTFYDDSGESSTDEYFIKINSKKSKKLRLLNRKQWSSEPLKLPPQCNIPSDLFDKHNYNNRQSTDSMESNQMENYEADDDNDFVVSFAYEN